MHGVRCIMLVSDTKNIRDGAIDEVLIETRIVRAQAKERCRVNALIRP
jgi:hypothetical protein